MKLKKYMAAFLLMLMILALAGCGNASPGEKAAVSTEMVDIVSQVVKSAGNQDISSTLSDEQKSNYTVLLNGCPDGDASYYLHDLTGNGIAELIMGTDTLTVYSCNQNDILTIGILSGQKLYLSETYGLMAYVKTEDAFELRAYKYNGEQMEETLLVSVSDEETYAAESESYLQDAEEMTPYALSDRTPFE